VVLGASTVALVALWWLGSPILGAIGAVMRVWLCALGLVVLAGLAPARFPRGPFTLLTRIILAIACEVGFELLFPSLLVTPGEAGGECYDRQGVYAC
jgi:hypothetical protein